MQFHADLWQITIEKKVSSRNLLHEKREITWYLGDINGGVEIKALKSKNTRAVSATPKFHRQAPKDVNIDTNDSGPILTHVAILLLPK